MTLDAIRARASQRPSTARPETQRVLDLPNLDPNEPVLDLTMRFQSAHGTMTLRDIQSRALLHIELLDGLIAPIGVGHGKTIITM